MMLRLHQKGLVWVSTCWKIVVSLGPCADFMLRLMLRLSWDCFQVASKRCEKCSFAESFLHFMRKDTTEIAVSCRASSNLWCWDSIRRAGPESQHVEKSWFRWSSVRIPGWDSCWDSLETALKWLRKFENNVVPPRVSCILCVRILQQLWFRVRLPLFYDVETSSEGVGPTLNMMNSSCCSQRDIVMWAPPAVSPRSNVLA